MQNSQKSNEQMKFDSFVLKNQIDNKWQYKQKKKKRLLSKIAFGSSQERQQNIRSPQLLDYQINYLSVLPHARNVLISKNERTQRSITEISKSYHYPINVKFPTINQQHIQENIKPCLFQVKEYTPKLYDDLPYTSDQLKEFFNQLTSKHKVKKPDQYFIF
ncbi:unnamed protein product [Paramecium pentaurelia]|uniref:Uncharacterized protein n=1 Tax=Paramecium pentaurelia TaxID=43138 RepID=A0A8S1WAX2_9CILI|nr:unnamed protein product [Paramecium pentaurelia]